MKTVLWLVGCGLVLNLCGTGYLVLRSKNTSEDAEVRGVETADPSGEVDYTYKAKLVRVIDGDTVILDIDLGFDPWLHNQTIRLYGIDAPEKTGDEKLAGKASRDWMQKRLYDEPLSVRVIKGNEDDSFGRWLGVLFADGGNVNDEIVEAGHAIKVV